MKTKYEDAIALGHCGVLLGSCWMKEMTHESLSALGGDGSPELKDALEKLDWEIPEPTVESVWTTDQFQSETVSAMQAFFDLLPGYQPPISLHDHIGVQLDYAGNLLIAAGNSREPEAFEPVLAFCGSRLGWIDGLLRGISALAQTDFYRGLSTATGRWVADVQDRPK